VWVSSTLYLFTLFQVLSKKLAIGNLCVECHHSVFEIWLLYKKIKLFLSSTCIQPLLWGAFQNLILRVQRMEFGLECYTILTLTLEHNALRNVPILLGSSRNMRQMSRRATQFCHLLVQCASVLCSSSTCLNLY
jgi:hypothetical protein